MEEVVEMVPEEVSAISLTTQEQYSNWKKNSILLYDYLSTHTAPWPALSCAFMPDVEIGAGTSTYRILSGTVTSGQATAQVSIDQLIVPTEWDLTEASFDVEKNEYITRTPPSGKIINELTIPHGATDVNKVRYNPFNPDLIATISHGVRVFDKTKHSKRGNEQVECTLTGHGCEGWGLSWNYQKDGLLASCTTDGKLFVHDLEMFDKNSRQLGPCWESSHQNGSNDVKWMYGHKDIFAAVGEELVSLYDIRSLKSIVSVQAQANCVDFCPLDDLVFATGSADGMLSVWDCRNVSHPTQKIDAHEGSISSLQFNPENHVIATAGESDCCVKLWDVSRNDPLLFIHGGHMLSVNDVSWHPQSPWTLCSVSMDNSMHIWRPNSVYTL